MSTDQKKAEDLILQVDADDLERARVLINDAKKRAEKAWIPGNMIASALALELHNCLLTSDEPDEVVDLLRRIAAGIEQQIADNSTAIPGPEVTRH